MPRASGGALRMVGPSLCHTNSEESTQRGEEGGKKGEALSVSREGGKRKEKDSA